MQGQLKKIQSLTQSVADQVVLVHNDIKNFSDVVASVKQEASAKKLERQDMPPKPAIFFGRDGLVKKVSAMLWLSETASHICLLGPGGMGKTSVSLAIVNSDLVQAKFQEGHRVWVPCLEATSATLFLQVLYTSLRVKRQTDNVMSDILDELNLSKDPYLLLLDNFETPWNTTDGQKRVKETLHMLNQLSHVSILITMRGSHSPIIDVDWHSEIVPATDMSACRHICESINPRWNSDPNIDNLVDAVGYMPFAVTLMASLGRQSGCSARVLLDEWKRRGTDMWSPDGSLESGMNKSISLSVDSEFVKNDPDALYLLATLSMLPAGTTRKNLGYWVPKEILTSRAINTLSEAALLQIIGQDNGVASQTLFVLPVIQSFMAHRNRIPKHIQQAVRSAFCKYVLDHACRYRDPTFKVNAEALAKEDVNIQSILVSAASRTCCDDQLVRALLAFSWYRRDTKSLIAVAVHTLNVAKANGNKRYIAEALLCLGSSYSEVSNYAEAKRVLEKSARMLAADDSGQSQQLGFECTFGRLHAAKYLREPRKGRQVLIDDLLARTKDSDAYWHARALEALGWIHWSFGIDQPALDVFVASADMMKDLGCTSDRAATLHGKARSLDHLYVPDEVVHEVLEEAWEIARHLKPSHVQGAVILHLGQVLVRMGRLVDAIDAFEKSLGSYQYIGAGLGVAEALESIGFVYLHTGAYSDAYLAFETAAETYAGLGEKSDDGKVYGRRCKENMASIKLKKKNPDQRIGFYRPRSIREWREFFYP